VRRDVPVISASTAEWLDLMDIPIGLGEGGSTRTDVVEDERASRSREKAGVHRTLGTQAG